MQFIWVRQGDNLWVEKGEKPGESWAGFRQIGKIESSYKQN